MGLKVKLKNSVLNLNIERFYTDSVKDWLTELVKLWPGVNAG